MVNGNTRYEERSRMAWVNEDTFSLPTFQRYKEILPGINWVNWNQPEVKAQNARLMNDSSSIQYEISLRKGGWIFPEKVYLNNPNFMSTAPHQVEDVDRHILDQPMCHSLKDRFDYITKDLLPKYIERVLERKNQVKIASFGSGTGRDVMTVMPNYPGVTANFYDTDESALSEGRKIAQEMGLQNRVQFTNQDLAKIRGHKFDLGLLVGIICPLPDRTANTVLRAVKRNFSEGSYLAVSSSSDRMGTEDPLCRFLIEYAASWFLEFRDAERMRQVMNSAGLEVVENGREPSGFNNMAVCKIQK
jgi:hypothetical protein